MTQEEKNMTEKTLRDEIAIAAMQTLLTKIPYIGSEYWICANSAYGIADLMIAAREKKEPE